MKHKFTKEEVRQIELAGLDMDQLDGLYEILYPCASVSEIPMSSAIENVAKILNQFNAQRLSS